MDYREIIRTEFLKRREKLPFYSLRTYAKDLNLSPQHLSLIFKGKSGLSKQKANYIVHQLGLKPIEAQGFLFLVNSQSGRALTTRNLAKMGLKKPFLTKAKEELKRRSENNLDPLPPIVKKQHIY
jgi:hypothetical protein